MYISSPRSRIIHVIMILSLSLPLLLCACSLFANRTTEAIVHIQANGETGQGVIIDGTGYVITSSHTVKGSQSVLVQLKSGMIFEAIVLCLNQVKDIAVLKMQGSLPQLQPLMPGDSDLVQQYDTINVIGYPSGAKDIKASKGIVISFPRTDDASYLQTNAALDPGSTGHLVLNKAGELIGIVAWNFDQPGREGWAITSNEVLSVLSQAKEAETDPLRITGVETTSISNMSAVISWMTNRPSTGVVEYGTDVSYGNRTLEDTALLKTHGSVLDNLQPKLTYHFRMRSVDLCGNEAISGDQTFTTMGTAMQAGKLTISNINVYNITSSTASIKWITSKPASTVVNYGTDKDSKPQTLSDSNLVHEHNVKLTELQPDTRYYVSISSSNEYDELAQLEIDPFSTPVEAIVCCRANCRLPDFNFKTLQGADFTSADITDHKVFMVFVKTGCSTCMAQAIYLNEIYQTWPEGSNVIFVVVVSGEKPSDIVEWMQKYGLSIPVYIDPTSEMANTCKFKTIPSAFFLDAGSVIKRFQSGGYASKRDMELALEEFR